MKYAVIDMGSNSIRLMIAEVVSGQLGNVEKYLEMTRLGMGVDTSKMLCETSMSATIDAIRQFKLQAESAQAILVGAFATSAVRDATNGAAFATRVFEETGVTVEIIPGAEEAELGYKGVVSGVDARFAKERFLIIDIGGGSTELIVGDVERIHYRHSFNVGVVRMTGKHIFTDPISTYDTAQLAIDVADILKEGVAAVKLLQPTVAIGIGGTATTFATMKLQMATYDRNRVHNAAVSHGELKEIVENLKGLTVAEKRELVGLMPKRADVIYAGGVILEHLLASLNLPKFYASDFDNLEGILVQKKIVNA